MKWTHNLSIGARLIFLVCFALVVALSVICTGMINNKRLADDTYLDYHTITKPLAATATALGEFNEMRTAFYGLALNSGSYEQNRLFVEQLTKGLSGYEQDIILYKNILDNYGTGDPREIGAVNHLYELLDPLQRQVEQLAEDVEKNRYAADVRFALSDDFLDVINDISANLMMLANILEIQTREANRFAERLKINSDIVSAVIMLMGSALLLLGAYAVVLSITRPLKEMTAVAQKVSGGELDIDIGYRSEDELGILADSFRNMVVGIKTYLNDKLQAERSAYEAELEKIDLLDKVHYDALTGIYNRRFLDENLNRVINTLTRSRGGMLSLLMIDVDFFKKYNDTYGHTKGDECLKAIAAAIASGVSRVDDFVARYGGEEFMVILPNTDANGALITAARIRKKVIALNIPHEKNEVADCVTVSIGAVTVDIGKGESAEEYIKRADEALYMSKNKGRNRYTFVNFSA